MLVTTNNYSSIVERLEKVSDELFVDTETTGLFPWSGSRVIGISIKAAGGGGGEDAYYFPFRHSEGNLPPELLPPLKRLLTKPHVVYTGFNYSFDLQSLYQDNFPLPAKICEVSAAAHLMNENEQYLRLKKLAEKYLGSGSAVEEAKLEELTISKGIGKGEMNKLPAHVVEPYACDDVRLTEKLKNFYVPELKKWKLYNLWLELCEYALVLTKIQCRGMQLDVPLIQQYTAEAKLEQDRTLSIIRNLTGNPKTNPRSHPQMQKWLGLPSTAAEFLEDYQDVPGVKELQEHRGWHRVVANYYDPFIKWMDSKQRLHPNMNMNGTETGRISSAKPPMQAIPVMDEGEKIYKVKDVFVAEPGYMWFEADYSLAEIRVGAHYAGTKVLKEKLDRDADIHQETADETHIPRPGAKRLNFSAQYGIGKDKLAQRLKIPVEEAARYLQRYHSRYPEIRAFYYRCQEIAEQRGYIRMFTGRIRHFNEHYAPTHKASSNLIQGSVAEMIRQAIQRLCKELNLEMHLQIHDSILGQVPTQYVSTILPEVKRIMEDTPWLTVKNKVDIKIGSRWGKLQKWLE